MRPRIFKIALLALGLSAATGISIGAGYLVQATRLASSAFLSWLSFLAPVIGFFIVKLYFVFLKKPLAVDKIGIMPLMLTGGGVYLLQGCFLVIIISSNLHDSVIWLPIGAFVLSAQAIGGYLAVYSRRKQERLLVLGVEQSDVSLKKLVQSVFESADFLSALRDTLPSGKDDHLFGFDHVPYLLRNIAERRKRFSKSSTIFLSLILSLGVLFVVLLGLFGYILIDDDATGSGRRLAQVSNKVLSIEGNLRYLSRLDISDSKELGASLRDLRSTMTLQQIGLSQDVSARLQADTIEALQRESLDSVARDLAALDRSALRPDQLLKLEALAEPIRKYTESQELSSANLRRDVAELGKIIPDLKKELEKDKSRIPELLKRITLGIVVASFFLAVLRYLAHIYQDHLQEVIKAERDDMAVRQFYVAFRCSSDNDDLRKLVLQEFMRREASSVTKAAEGDLKQGPEYDILKEMLAIMSKKVG